LPHLLPPVIVILLLSAPSYLLVPARLTIAVGYGAALIRLGQADPDALDRVQLDGALSVRRALLLTGMTTIAEGFVDLAIDIDFIRAHGAQAGWIAGGATLLFIAVLGYAAVTAGDSVSSTDETITDMGASEPPTTTATSRPEPDDGQVMASLEAAMRRRNLYRDPELSLDRLARKLTIPARRISAAVNRSRAMNVSQYINRHRVCDACRRLAETDNPVTQIMFESGFQTKSNFNRIPARHRQEPKCLAHGPSRTHKARALGAYKQRLWGRTSMKAPGYGLIGSGFMGKCHAQAMNRVARTFAVAAQPRLELSPAVDTATAEKAATALGFARGRYLESADRRPGHRYRLHHHTQHTVAESAFHFRRARVFPVDQRHLFDRRQLGRRLSTRSCLSSKVGMASALRPRDKLRNIDAKGAAGP
jgi:AraC-like DNA-binding protein